MLEHDDKCEDDIRPAALQILLSSAVFLYADSGKSWSNISFQIRKKVLIKK